MADVGRGNSSTFERHLQTAISAIAVAMLGWVGVTLNSLQQSVTRLEEQTRTAAQKVAVNDSRIANIEDKYIDLMLRLDRLER